MGWRRELPAERCDAPQSPGDRSPSADEDVPMTEPLRLGGVPIDALLARDRPGLAGTLLDAVRAETPEYALLPAEAMTSDVTSAIENALRLFIDTLRTARFPDDEQLAVLRESAARR